MMISSKESLGEGSTPRQVPGMWPIMVLRDILFRGPAGKIYHLDFSPPPDDADLRARLTQRSDDTEEKCRVRLEVSPREITISHALLLFVHFRPSTRTTRP